MGIDALDIVFRLERKFDIQITREDFFRAFPDPARGNFQAKCLLDLVISKLPDEIAPEAGSSHVVDAQALEDSAWVWLQSQFPSRSQGDLLPRFSRETWQRFERQGVHPPPLGLGSWRTTASLVELIGGLAALAASAGVFSTVVESSQNFGLDHPTSALVAGVAAIAVLLLIVVLVRMTVAWRLATQPDAQSMGELAVLLAQYNVRFFARRAGEKLSREHIWNIIRNELSDILAIEESKISPESDLVKDLQMD